jgi:hypothetical protein
MPPIPMRSRSSSRLETCLGPMRPLRANPADGKLLKKFDDLTDEQLENMLVAAATCFETRRHEAM